MTIRDRIKRIDPVAMVALVIIVIGVCWLYSAMGRAVPVVDWGTSEEERTAREARPHVYAASGVLGLGALTLLTGGRRIAALLVAPAAVVPAVLLACTNPDWALPLLATLITIPFAIGAGIAAAFKRRRTR
ncbi:hypothetical protein BZB76_4421 [Actinomadura pelletieri DSM 43383]|uniref:Uncharacterized protein n=1 Tax=Actinomadura pelletieri DSM 43383 TaxID=1120940 RepID=A0A495QMI0_9ACTN|nr:hypothetical protein [Actinomadura pelletieri]RKS73718.1 hypothetical protein BZB76_4421 [Actinomadura pelletieri DSM 43383]